MGTVSNKIEPQGLALVGNPGAGKSTILNGIAGDPIFKSGISLGSGLTSVLQEQDIFVKGNALTLFDTPGLADMEKKIQAGKEIDKVLSTNIAIKLAFVVTLENGRVKPDDAATVKLVLQAITSVDVKNRFGVIINQVSPGVMRQLNDDPEKAAKVRSAITDAYPTSHWIYVPKDPQLEDAADQQLMTVDLHMFFAGLPTTKPAGAEVKEIDTSDMEKIIAEQEKRISELQRANEVQRQEMVNQLKKHNDEAQLREKEIKERLAHLEIRMGRAQSEAKQEKDKLGRLWTNITNRIKIATGTAAAIVLANPAPLMAAKAMCKTLPKPKREAPANSKEL